MVFSYPPSGSAPALSGTHARARSNVYQDISQGILGDLTRRGGLRSQRGGYTGIPPICIGIATMGKLRLATLEAGAALRA